MQPVDTVLTAMSRHNAQTLANAYTPDAVIVDDQQPYHWSGKNAPSDWLSALTTFGKLHYASFKAFGNPMQIVHGPDSAYVTIIGRLRGTGPRSGSSQFATMTFSLSKVGNDWKITSQSWADIPPPKL
jgi:ketosteroid isomerase-like protein